MPEPETGKFPTPGEFNGTLTVPSEQEMIEGVNCFTSKRPVPANRYVQVPPAEVASIDDATDAALRKAILGRS